MNKYILSHTKWKCQYHIIFMPKYRQNQEEEDKQASRII